MLAKRVIACLDVMAGRTVKGVNFGGLKDAGDIVELAARYGREGADELVFLDITASAERRATMPLWVERVARALDIPFTVGGGVASEKDVEELLRRGADKVSINTAALHDPGLITRLSRTFGAQCVVVAIDARREGSVWRVYSHGGKRSTGYDLFEWAAKAQQLGCGEILFTSMDNDGTREGFANDAMARLADTVTVPIIASGGAGNPCHFLQAFTVGHADAALAAGIFHYGQTTIGEVKNHLAANGIEVRRVPAQGGY